MINNGRFKGVIDNKSLYDYNYKLDYEIENLDKRKQLVNEVFNLDEIGSKDLFWQEVWDMAQCKSGLNTTDTLWSDTDVAKVLESVGTYLLVNNKENNRYSRPKENNYESCMENYSNSEYDILKNDKNYRLAPPEDINKSDYKLREVFSKDYNYYKDVLYVNYINKLKEKIKIDTISRYGYHDGSFDNFSCGKLMDEETWNNLKRLEIEKINLLMDAKHNIDILRNQAKLIRNKNYIYNKGKSNVILDDISYINVKNNIFIPNYLNEYNENMQVYKHEFMDRIIPCHLQLKKYGLNNDTCRLIEEKCLYKTRTKNLKLTLSAVNSNIANVKDYMIMCKLSYQNRVCIDGGKNSVVMDILDHIDYNNDKHIESILYLSGNEISYENDMSIISYDINKAIQKAFKNKLIDNKDMYIIEGIRHNITQENIGKEIGIKQQNVNKRIKKIVDKLKKVL